MADSLNIHSNSDEHPKKLKKDPIQWTEELEAVLAAQFFKWKAYIRTDVTAVVQS